MASTEMFTIMFTNWFSVKILILRRQYKNNRQYKSMIVTHSRYFDNLHSDTLFNKLYCNTP